MLEFQEIQADNPIKEVINSAFDMKLDIEGAWGYTQELSTIILSTDSPLPQLQHILASMRTHIEMAMTLTEEERYGSINLTEISREEVDANYHKVVYKVTAMKESLYKAFIGEYKEHHGSKEFDMKRHFEKREEATLKREVVYWFKV